MCNLSFLEHPGAIEILTTLFEKKEEIYLAQLTENFNGSNTTVKDRLKELIEAGIIKDRYEKKRSKKNRLISYRYIWLTEKGRKIAKKLVEMEKIIEGL